MKNETMKNIYFVILFSGIGMLLTAAYLHGGLIPALIIMGVFMAILGFVGLITRLSDL